MESDWRLMKPRVYLETTIPSYLTAWASRDLIRAAHQQLTREWWARRGAFELYSSRLVVEECQAGDPKAAADRLEAMANVPLLEQTTDVDTLAEALLREVPRPTPSTSPSQRSMASISCSHGIAPTSPT